MQTLLVALTLTSSAFGADGVSLTDAPSSASGTWDLALGAQMRYSPDYPGASQSSTLLAPMVQARYASSMGTFRLGILPSALPAVSYSPYDTPDATVGIALGVSPGRSESAPQSFKPGSERLLGMGVLPDTPVLALFGRYRWQPVTFNAVFSQAVQRDQGHGGQVGTLHLGLALPTPQGFSSSVGVGLNWASQSYMQALLGVTPTQSAKTGWAVYAPRSGVRDYVIDAKLRYHPGRAMVWHTGLEWVQWATEAANSPLVERKLQAKATLGVTYHWQ